MTRSVPLLANITLGYSHEEDRLRLDGADAAGETTTLWLTARLMNRLVPHLIKRQTDMQLSIKKLGSTDIEGADLSAVESTAVQCEPGSPEVLVASVDVSSHGDQLLLIFKDWGEAQRAAFVMPSAALQQWHGGLLQCYEQAGWPRDVFERQHRPETSQAGAVTIH